jgi:HemY protein
LKDDKTRFVGVRGLMKQTLEKGDTDTAMKLAEKAFALKPKHEDTQNVLLQLQADAGEWSSARKTLNAKLKHGTLPRDVHRRRDAILALSEAADVMDDSKSIEAREAAIAANRQSPDLIPAAVMASDAYVEQGKPKYAARVIRKAWEVAPHPDLAAAFARIAPDESPADRVKRFAVLTNMHRDNPETVMLNAELLIAAEDFPAARKALGDLAETDPTARSLTIMAAIERGSGADDAIVKGWLARALTAPRGPQWVCENCGKAHADWMPVCDSCSGFDTLSWTRPKVDTAPMPSGAEMLPLIVGQIKGPEDAEIADAEEVYEDTISGSEAEEPQASDVVEPEDAELVEETASEDENKKEAS